MIASRVLGVCLSGLVAALVPAATLIAAPAAGAAIEPGTVYGHGTVAGAAGTVRYPEGIGLDPISGRVALADYSNSRISIFEPDGTFVLAFGKDVDPAGGTGPEVCTTTCKAGVAGAGAGELNSPYEAEFSPSGKEIYVGDSGNRRISVFDAGGHFLRAFGRDVDPAGGTGPEICTTSCQKGSSGGTGAAFENLWPLTFGPDGLLYAADEGGYRISVFTPGGHWVRSFGKDVIAGGTTGFESCTVAADCKYGAGDGTLESLFAPEGLDFDPSGRLWVAASNANHGWVSTPGTLTPQAVFGKDVTPGGGSGYEVCIAGCQAGASGAGPGEIAFPNGLGISPDGTVYIADVGNDRVDVYHDNLSFAFALGADVVPGGGTGFETCTSDCKAGLADQVSGFDFPYAVAVDCRGIVYVTNDVGDAVPARAYSEPGVEPGPCRLATRSVKRNKRKGTAKLTVEVPYPSQLDLTGRRIRRASGSHTGLDGLEKLAVKPRGRLAKRLRRKGHAKAHVTVAMTPGGDNVAQTATATVKLRKKHHRRH